MEPDRGLCVLAGYCARGALRLRRPAGRQRGRPDLVLPLRAARAVAGEDAEASVRLPAFTELLPHIMVLVQLEEGPRLAGYMIKATPEQMRIGMSVRVAFKRLTDDVTLPVWEPA